jgi:glucosamine-6-phosphate deaminase
MTSTIDPQQLLAWCRIPAEDLETHPDAKVKIKIVDTPDDVHRWAARDMIEEVRANNAAGRPTRWILPCGPTKQYGYFAQQVNAERISLRDVHVFHMDDFLDWETRHLPLEHPFCYRGWMLNNFYGPIDPELAIPPHQRHFPSTHDLDSISRAIEDVGGVDTTYGGVGYRGHIAYNEPPQSPWYSVTPQQFRNSKTRTLHLNDDTLIAVSQRTVGGLSHAVPPMAITMGMKDLLSAGRVRLMSDTGAWKRTVVRMLLFGPVTTEYSVTFVQEHADAMIVIDRNTAVPPLEGIGNV